MSTRHSPPDNVLQGNRSTVPPYPSSFLIHHRAIPWHTLATYQWGALPSSRGDVFAPIFSLLRIQSPTRQRLRGRSSCGRHSIHRASSATGPWTHRGRGETGNRAVDTQGQRRDIVSGQEICSGKWRVPHGCQVVMHNSAITYSPPSPAIARSSWFVLVRLPARLHVSFPTVGFAVRGCRKEFPPCIHVHEVPPCLHVHVHGHVSSLYRKEFPRCLQRPRPDVFAAIIFTLHIHSADTTALTGPFQVQKVHCSSSQLFRVRGSRRDSV